MSSDKRDSSRCYPSAFFPSPEITDIKVFASRFYSVVSLLPVHAQVHIHRRTKSRSCIGVSSSIPLAIGKEQERENICGVLCLPYQWYNQSIPKFCDLLFLSFLFFLPDKLILSSSRLSEYTTKGGVYHPQGDGRAIIFETIQTFCSPQQKEMRRLVAKQSSQHRITSIRHFALRMRYSSTCMCVDGQRKRLLQGNAVRVCTFTRTHVNRSASCVCVWRAKNLRHRKYRWLRVGRLSISLLHPSRCSSSFNIVALFILSNIESTDS